MIQSGIETTTFLLVAVFKLELGSSNQSKEA